MAAATVILALLLGQSQEQKSLEGARAFAVEVGDLGGDAQDVNLSAERLRTEVELKLRSSGLRILPLESADGVVFVRAGVLRVDEHRLLYDVRVDVQQAVRLVRSKKTMVVATTWAFHASGYAGTRVVHNTVMREIEAAASTLANEWLAANGR